ncbi:MAG TPA: RNA pseudouridine synthase [Geobacterales bacterium]|nr:RNA pseudouridine synthase [Geobacterales bacterium]
MQTTRQSPPKPKHPPRGVTLLYEDGDILVVDKPSGLLTMGTERDKSRTVHSILNDYVRKGNPKSRNRVYIVHRLDRDTSGILLFAKSEEAKQFLQSDWDNTTKIYLTVVSGRLTPPEGTISSYLAENAAFNVYSTPDPAKGKLSHTAYRLVKEHKGLTLLRIHLLTGRKHQIRVQLAEKGHPVVGDTKYGRGHASSPQLALHAYSIEFTHPVSASRLCFATAIPPLFARLVGTFELLEPEVN